METSPINGVARFEAVAIGASAGGVSALMTLVAALPRDLHAAVLVVQHLDPKRKSQLADLLGRHATMRVKQAEFAEEIVPGCVYTAPPDAHLLVTNRRIALTRSKLVHFARPSIDLLFESVAETYHRRSIGVILTGSGVDGAVGLRLIKQAGGTTIVQDPKEAEHRRMPEAALLQTTADFVLRLNDIAPTIADLVQGVAAKT
jgi:two-component system chemotaxis response regulator CheB